MRWHERNEVNLICSKDFTVFIMDLIMLRKKHYFSFNSLGISFRILWQLVKCPRICPRKLQVEITEHACQILIFDHPLTSTLAPRAPPSQCSVPCWPRHPLSSLWPSTGSSVDGPFSSYCRTDQSRNETHVTELSGNRQSHAKEDHAAEECEGYWVMTFVRR